MQLKTKIKYLFLIMLLLIPFRINAITVKRTGSGNSDGYVVSGCSDYPTCKGDWYSFFYSVSSTTKPNLRMYCLAHNYYGTPSPKGSTYYRTEKYDIKGVGAACAYINNNIDSKYKNWDVGAYIHNSNYYKYDAIVRNYIINNINSTTKCSKYTKDTSFKQNYCNSTNQGVIDNTNSSIKVSVGNYTFNDNWKQAKITITKTGSVSNYNINVSGIDGAIITKTDATSDKTNVTSSSSSTLYLKVPYDKTGTAKIKVDAKYTLTCHYIMPTIVTYFPEKYVDNANDGKYYLNSTGKSLYNETTGRALYKKASEGIQAVGYFGEEKGSVSKDYTKSFEISNKPINLSSIEITKKNKSGKTITSSETKFSIYTDNNCSKIYKNLSGKELSDQITSKGVLTILNLPTGKYYIKETKTPDGYLLNEECKLVDVKEAGKTYLVEVIDDKIPQITIKKVDSVNTKDILTGAKIRIYYGSNNCSGNKYDDVIMSSGSHTIDANKIVNNGKLITGLSIKEIEAPDGYVRPSDNNCTDLSDKLTPNFNGNYLLENTKKPILTINKVDSNNDKITNSAAEIGIYSDSSCNAIIEEKYTSKGVVNFSLNPGTYYYKEKEAPNGYVLNNTCSSIVLDSNETILIKNEKISTIKVTKKEKDSDKVLAGVKFKLYSNSNCSGTALNIGDNGELTTDNNGEINIPVSKGNYSLKEVFAPDEYVEDYSCIENLSIDAGEVKKVIVENELKKSTLQINKKTDNGGVLSGITFGLYSDDTCNNLEGKTKSTDTDGTVSFSDLDSGKTYYYKEIDNDGEKDGFITKDSNTYLIDTGCNPVSDLKPGETTTKDVYNALRIASNLIIEKKDAFGNYISGAKFKLCTDEACKHVVLDYDNFYLTPNGASGSDTNKDTGRKVIDDLSAGVYYVKEEEAPKGYAVRSDNTNSDNTKKVTLSYSTEKLDGDPVTVTFVNDKKPSLTVKKISSTGESLAGIEFELYKKENDKLYKKLSCSDSDINLVYGLCSGDDYSLFKTVGNDGSFKISGLDAGFYYLQEKAIENGDYYFDGDGKHEEFELKLNEDHTELIVNNKYSEISFKKVDDLGSPIAGAKFELYTLQDCSGDSISKFTRDDGLVKFDHMPIGTYYVKETFAPDRYIKDDTCKEVKIDQGDQGKTIFLSDVINERSLSFTIKKVDSNGKALNGAKFNVYSTTGGCIGLNEGDIPFANFEISSNGVVSTGPLNQGNYCVQEVDAPDGYVKTEEYEYQSINLNADGKVLTFVNGKKPTLEIVKYDSNGNKLSGAQFKIYSGHTIDDDGNCSGDNGAIYTIEADGKIVINNMETGK